MSIFPPVKISRYTVLQNFVSYALYVYNVEARVGIMSHKIDIDNIM